MIPPGGVRRRVLGSPEPEVVALASNFASKVDRGGRGGKQYRIFGDFIAEAKKLPVAPYTTTLTLFSPPGEWISGAILTAEWGVEDSAVEVPYDYLISEDNLEWVFLGLDLSGNKYLLSLEEEFEPFSDIAPILNKALSSFSISVGTGEVALVGNKTPLTQTSLIQRSHQGVSMSRVAVATVGKESESGTLAQYTVMRTSGKRVPLFGDKGEYEANTTQVFDLTISPSGFRRMFGTPSASMGVLNVGGRAFQCPGLWTMPHFSYVLPTNKLLIVAPLQDFNPAANNFRLWIDEYNRVADTVQAPDRAYYAPNPRAVRGKVALGVAVLDLTLPEDEVEAFRAEGGNYELPDEAITALKFTLHDLGLTDAYQPSKASGTYSYIMKATGSPPDYDFEIESRAITEPRVMSEDTPLRSHVLNTVSTVRMRDADEEPVPPPELPAGVIQPLYGADYLITAQLISYEWADPPAGVEYTQPFAAEEIPTTTQSTFYYTQAACLTIVDLETMVAQHHVLSKSDLYIGHHTGWVPGQKDEFGNLNPSGLEGVPPAIHGVADEAPLEQGYLQQYQHKYHSPAGVKVPYHIFYAPSGPAIPAVVVQMDQRKYADIMEADTFTYSGDFDDADVKFTLYFPTADGFQTVEFDLGGYLPPRPVMYGLSLGQAFQTNFGDYNEPLARFWYNDTNPQYTAVDRVVAGAGENIGTEDAPFINRRNHSELFSAHSPYSIVAAAYTSSPIGRSDYGVRYLGDEVDDRSLYTSSRLVNTAPNTRRIHAHLGDGLVAVIATNEASPANVWFNWSLVVCRESTGEFVEVRSVLPIPETMPYDLYPLESSNWLHLERIADNTLLLSVESYSEIRSYASTDPAVGHASDSTGKERIALSRVHGSYSPRILEGASFMPEDNLHTFAEKFISYDGGYTWELFIENLPGDLYYLGNSLAMYKGGLA